MIVESLSFNEQQLKLLFLLFIKTFLDYLAFKDPTDLILTTGSRREAGRFDHGFLGVRADQSVVVFFHLCLFTLNDVSFYLTMLIYFILLVILFT